MAEITAPMEKAIMGDVVEEISLFITGLVTAGSLEYRVITATAIERRPMTLLVYVGRLNCCSIVNKPRPITR